MQRYMVAIIFVPWNRRHNSIAHRSLAAIQWCCTQLDDFWDSKSGIICYCLSSLALNTIRKYFPINWNIKQHIWRFLILLKGKKQTGTRYTSSLEKCRIHLSDIFVGFICWIYLLDIFVGYICWIYLLNIFIDFFYIYLLDISVGYIWAKYFITGEMLDIFVAAYFQLG